MNIKDTVQSLEENQGFLPQGPLEEKRIKCLDLMNKVKSNIQEANILMGTSGTTLDINPSQPGRKAATKRKHAADPIPDDIKNMRVLGRFEPDALQCQCGKQFESDKYLIRHKAKHIDTSSYLCSICMETGYKFKDFKTLWRHFRQIHLGLWYYKCDTCSKGFDEVGNLMSHLSKEHNRKSNITCPHCKKEMTTTRHVQYHLAGGHCPNYKP